MRAVHELAPQSIDLVYRQLVAARHSLERALGPNVSDATELALHNIHGIENLLERYRPDEDDAAMAVVEGSARVMTYSDLKVRRAAFQALKAQHYWRVSK